MSLVTLVSLRLRSKSSHILPIPPSWRVSSLRTSSRAFYSVQVARHTRSISLVVYVSVSPNSFVSTKPLGSMKLSPPRTPWPTSHYSDRAGPSTYRPFPKSTLLLPQSLIQNIWRGRQVTYLQTNHPYSDLGRRKVSPDTDLINSSRVFSFTKSNVT